MRRKKHKLHFLRILKLSQYWILGLTSSLYSTFKPITMTYQEKVKNAFGVLENAKIQVFIALVNVAMHSEFKAIDELFEEGEQFSFRSSDFDHALDPNIQSLQHVVKSIEIAKNQMLGYNGANNLDL